mmetsp:Transcript_38448/g.89176  ORF Transcript_38448/g.89176 Transcript_38448/m.89176 type:complete len:252 (+) Transcript_38448:141-896(+)
MAVQIDTALEGGAEGRIHHLQRKGALVSTWLREDQRVPPGEGFEGDGAANHLRDLAPELSQPSLTYLLLLGPEQAVHHPDKLLEANLARLAHVESVELALDGVERPHRDAQFVGQAIAVGVALGVLGVGVQRIHQREHVPHVPGEEPANVHLLLAPHRLVGRLQDVVGHVGDVKNPAQQLFELVQVKAAILVPLRALESVEDVCGLLLAYAMALREDCSGARTALHAAWGRGGLTSPIDRWVGGAALRGRG